MKLKVLKSLILALKMGMLQGKGLWKSRFILLILLKMPGPDPR